MAKPTYNPEPEIDLLQHLNDALRRAVVSVPTHLIFLSERELFRKINPTPLDYALRVSFWREYERIMLNGGSELMTAASVCNGICTPNQFYNLLKKPERVAWMIKPKQSYQKEMEAILSRGTERLWELMELPIYSQDGKPSADIARIVLQAIKQVEDRVKGMAVQRSMTVTANVQSSQAMRSIESMEEINARIKQLEGVINASEQPGGSGGNADDKALPEPKKNDDTLELRVVSEWRTGASEPPNEEEDGDATEPLQVSPE